MLLIRFAPSFIYILKGVKIVSFDNVNTRRHPRYLYSDNIEFSVDYSTAGTRLRGISVNISDSGIGLYTFKPIYAGQTITVETALPVPYRKAIVIWVQKRYEVLYKVGLKFTSGGTAPATVGLKENLS
jgi:hypothetical protein